MKPPARWSAIGAMIAVLAVLFLITPKTATQFALVILLIAIGYGYQKKKFALK